MKKQKHVGLSSTKNLQNKSVNSTPLKSLGKLFINGSMCRKTYHLAFKCCQLKSSHKNHLTWFCNITFDINCYKLLFLVLLAIFDVYIFLYIPFYLFSLLPLFLGLLDGTLAVCIFSLILFLVPGFPRISWNMVTVFFFSYWLYVV